MEVLNSTEGEFRKRVQFLFDTWQKRFERVDPDWVECDVSSGGFTFILKDQFKCILSLQPSIQQLWLAIASHGIAYHFFYDESLQQWREYKKPQLELTAVLEGFFSEVLGPQGEIWFG